MKYISVALPLPVRNEFTYSADDKLVSEGILGKRVTVTFGSRKLTGYAMSFTRRPEDTEVLPIERTADDTPVISSLMTDFIRWMSQYYICGPGETVRMALPGALDEGFVKKIIFVKYGDDMRGSEEQLLKFLKEFGPVTEEEAIKAYGPGARRTISALIRKGLTGTVSEIKIGKKEVLYNGFRLTNADPGSDSHKKLLERSGGESVILQKDLRSLNISSALISRAVKEGAAEKIKVRKDHFDRLLKENIVKAPALELESGQKTCEKTIIDSFESDRPGCFLLHGITGSGKTAVYISAVSRIVRKGRTALVLVPEISLTPQMVRKFRSHLGDTVAVMHSRQSELEKYEIWSHVKNGRYSVVIGPRSAIFAPLENIGIIIVDEEHDQSYKQTSRNPRYNARDCAVMLGTMHKAVVVLGSATPSAESYYNARTGKYGLLELSTRYAGAVLPSVRIVRKENPGILFEKSTVKAVERELNRPGKVIVLQNRRGYAPTVVCSGCRETVMCPSCSVPLAFHLDRKQLICHYCGHFQKSTGHCPGCGEESIIFRGAGTEQVEEELKRLFPSVPVFRMDQDSTKRKNAHSDILDRFSAKGPAILTGTRMIAKGLDFHDVTLVVIANLDSELMFPDFRADERAFQLSEQVAGRAGRGMIPGEVLIQVFNGSAPVIDYIRSHDSAGFIAAELQMREAAGYPPLSRLIKITLSSKDHDTLIKSASEIYGLLVSEKSGCTIYRPAEKMILKVNNIFRLYILVKSLIINDRSGNRLRGLVSGVFRKLRLPSSVRADIDVDPADLM